MTRLALALALIVGVGAAPPPTTLGAGSPRPLAADKEQGALLGAVRGSTLERLARLDETTLRPLPGRTPVLGRSTDAWAFSPDRSQIVFASQRVNSTPALRFVDVARMRTRADLGLPADTYVQALAWIAPRRLLALHTTTSGYAVTVVDPRRPRLLSRRYFEGAVANVGRWPGGLVVLVGRAQSIGPSRLVVFEAGGAMRSVELSEILAGWEMEEDHLGRTRAPALAVDSSGRTAYAVDPTGRVAEIDLATLVVSYHTPGEPQSLLSRFAAWLQPAAAAKAFEGPTRSARFVADGVLAVYGEDHYAVPDPGEGFREGRRGAGLTLIDTRTWTSRVIDPTSSEAWADSGGVLSVSTVCERESCRGDGVTGYTARGDRRFKLLEGKTAWVDAVYAGRAYVYVSHERMRVVDLQTGAVEEREAPLPRVLLGPAGPDFG